MSLFFFQRLFPLTKVDMISRTPLFEVQYIEIIINNLQETHVIHQFEQDFYGSNLKIAILGYLRKEMNFSSLDDLKAQIKKDIDKAVIELERPDYQSVKSLPFFTNS